MVAYYLIFLWLGLMASLAKKPQYNEILMIDEKEEIRNKFFFAFIVFLPICIMAMNRETATMGDMDGYLYSFKRAPSTMTGIWDYLNTVYKDKGYAFLVVFIRSFITTDKRFFALIIALIQCFCLVPVCRKYSSKYVLSIFMFVASTDMISWMYNGIRQGIAAFLIFAATPLMLKKKYVPLLGIILLASTIHRSALIMIPFVLIASNEAWNKKTIFFIIAILAIVFSISNFTGFLDEILADTQYKNVVSEGAAGGGTNVLRVLVYAVPTIFAFVYRKRMRVINNPLIDFCTNMSIISTGMYVVSIFAGGLTFGRLPIYANLYNYILLPWEIDHFFERNREAVIVIMVICYLIFYFYQMHVIWGYL